MPETDTLTTKNIEKNNVNTSEIDIPMTKNIENGNASDTAINKQTTQSGWRRDANTIETNGLQQKAVYMTECVPSTAATQTA